LHGGIGQRRRSSRPIRRKEAGDATGLADEFERHVEQSVGTGLNVANSTEVLEHLLNMGRAMVGSDFNAQ
jgi:hypothetical protein